MKPISISADAVSVTRTPSFAFAEVAGPVNDGACVVVTICVVVIVTGGAVTVTVVGGRGDIVSIEVLVSIFVTVVVAKVVVNTFVEVAVVASGFVTGGLCDMQPGMILGEGQVQLGSTDIGIGVFNVLGSAGKVVSLAVGGVGVASPGSLGSGPGMVTATVVVSVLVSVLVGEG